MKVMMKAPFDTYSGYGNDAVDMAIALAEAGIDLTPFPTSIVPGLPSQFLALLGKPGHGDFDMVFQFGPPQEIDSRVLKRLAPKRVGYSMWERNPLTVEDFDFRIGEDKPNDAWFADRVMQQRAWDGLDRMIVTCPMNVDAFGHVDKVTPITVQPCGVDTKFWSEQTRDADRPFTFLSLGLLAGRKNPFALLETWSTMKRDMPEFDARLVLHTTAGTLHPSVTEAYGPDVVLSTEPLSKKEILALYASSDVFVSTSRGEGNCKPAMEFMSTGGPVIAPDWSGFQNYVTPGNGWLVDGRLVPAEGAANAVEFEIDRAGLANAMIAAWSNRGQVRKMGMAASSWMASAYDWKRVGQDLARQLNEVAYAQ